MSPRPLRVAVAGSPLVRSSIGRALSTDDVITVDGIDDLVHQCRQELVDVAISPVELDGATLSVSLADVLSAGARVLVLDRRSSLPRIPELLFGGASGSLLLEECSATELRAGVESVAGGASALHPDVAAEVLALWRLNRGGAPSRPRLTEREQDVLGLIARGASVKEMARTLTLSPKTVESHLGRLYAKLGVRSSAQAVQAALEAGLVERPERRG